MRPDLKLGDVNFSNTFWPKLILKNFRGCLQERYPTSFCKPLAIELVCLVFKKQYIKNRIILFGNYAVQCAGFWYGIMSGENFPII